MPDETDLTGAAAAVSDTSSNAASSESVSTSASTDAAAAASSQSQASDTDKLPPRAEDVWNSLGNNEPTATTSAAEEKPEITDKGTPPDKVAEETEDEAKTEEKADEDAVLADLFGTDKQQQKDATEELTEEMIKSLRPAAQAAARRNEKKAELVKAFQFADTPIEQVAESFRELNPDRFTQLSQHAAHALVDSDPDATFQRAYAVKMLAANPNWDYRQARIPTLDEVISGQAKPTTATTAAAPENQTAQQNASELSALTGKLDETFDFDWRDPENDFMFLDERELALAQAARTAEAELKKISDSKEAENGELKTLREQMRKIQEQMEGETQSTLQTEMRRTVSDYRQSIESKIIPYIAKFNGLEVKDTDTPEIKQFKETLMQNYTGTPYQRAAGEESLFESFAYNESTVKGELERVVSRIVAAQAEETKARLAGDDARARKFHAAADEEKVPMYQLLTVANKEFKQARIDPFLKVIESLSPLLTAPITDASQRAEIVGNSAGVGASPRTKLDYATADDVWNGVVAEARNEANLRTS